MNIRKVVEVLLDENGKEISNSEKEYFVIENNEPKVRVECENYQQALTIFRQLSVNAFDALHQEK